MHQQTILRRQELAIATHFLGGSRDLRRLLVKRPIEACMQSALKQ
jgi:hypothetical protein